jgi:hypothetical protein
MKFFPLFVFWCLWFFSSELPRERIPWFTLGTNALKLAVEEYRWTQVELLQKKEVDFLKKGAGKGR